MAATNQVTLNDSIDRLLKEVAAVKHPFLTITIAGGQYLVPVKSVSKEWELDTAHHLILA